MTAKTPRVGVYGYFGMGNVGNEGSLSAFLDHLVRHHPDVALRCFAFDAEEVERAHSIPAVQLMALRHDGQGPLAKTLKALSRLWDVPRTYALMGDIDTLLVPGTGVLATRPAAPAWGMPYWLFLAVLCSRLRQRRVALVSVGAELPAGAVTRCLFRWTVTLSNYCSVRDVQSQRVLRTLGVGHHVRGVYPDLAFGLSRPCVASTIPRRVVIGVMSYEGSLEDADRGPHIAHSYVRKMSEVVSVLLREGRSVTLVAGDASDFETASRIQRAVRQRHPDLALSSLRTSAADNMSDLMMEMGTAEVVVATRFHNAICGLLAGKPVVSLGYAEKNLSLLKEFGLGEYSQSVDTFEIDTLLEHIRKAIQSGGGPDSGRELILTEYREQLRQQMCLLTEEFLTAARRGDRRATDNAVRRRARIARRCGVRSLVPW